MFSQIYVLSHQCSAVGQSFWRPDANALGVGVTPGRPQDTLICLCVCALTAVAYGTKTTLEQMRSAVSFTVFNDQMHCLKPEIKKVQLLLFALIIDWTSWLHLRQKKIWLKCPLFTLLNHLLCLVMVITVEFRPHRNIQGDVQ